MDRLEIGFAGIAAVLGLLALRMPIGLALGLVSFFGIFFATNITAAWGLLRAIPFQFTANWSFSAVPMFLLMGYIASHGGLTNGLFTGMRTLLARVPGGLACSTVGACALFAAASGSSVATAAAMSRIAVPEMLKLGYDKALATGTVAAAGTLGALIPPSILLVIFGVFTQVSVGKLFAAGFLPGILSALVYMAVIVLRVLSKPSLAPERPAAIPKEELRQAIKDSWPLPIIIVGVLGGIFLGIMTPTEAGAIGAAIALLIAGLRGRVSLGMLTSAAKDAASGTSVLFVIAIGAAMFSSFMGLTGVPKFVANSLLPIADSPLQLILLIAIIYIVLGMFIDSIGLMLLTLPLLMPLLDAADVNMIWFGIIIVKLLEIGMITPPVGLNVYVINSALKGKVSLPTIFHGTFWFILGDIVTLGLLIGFPIIALWLPELMK